MKIIRRASGPILLLATAVLTSAASCRGEDSPEPTDPPVQPVGTQFIVAVDLSTSLTATERESHEALLHALVRGLEFRDRLVLLQAHAAGVRNSAPPWVIAMPVPRGRKPLEREKRALELARETADLYVTSLFKNEPTVGSDLLATMHTAGAQALQGGGARNVLVVLSDMLHCVPRKLCMESSHVPDSAWITAQEQQGLVPSLDSVCVSVVGADASTIEGVKVREFWRRYFRAAGAGFSPARYMHSATSPDVLRCTG